MVDMHVTLVLGVQHSDHQFKHHAVLTRVELPSATTQHCDLIGDYIPWAVPFIPMTRSFLNQKPYLPLPLTILLFLCSFFVLKITARLLSPPSQ